jgi:hypothetical protein
MLYRIYHKEYKYEEPFAVDQFGDIFLLFGDFIYEEIDDESPIKIERCSGVKDASGELIYENDIVSYDFNGETHENQLVTYCEKTASFKFGDRSLADTFNYLVGGIHNFTITGNAHND